MFLDPPMKALLCTRGAARPQGNPTGVLTHGLATDLLPLGFSHVIMSGTENKSQPDANPDIPSLIAAVDAAYQSRDFHRAELLDASLEILLDDLEHRLLDLEEGDDVLDNYDGAGIEDQFISAWSYFLAGIGSFRTSAELADHFRAVLDDQVRGGCSPADSRVACFSDDYLVALASDLWNERQAHILGVR